MNPTALVRQRNGTYRRGDEPAPNGGGRIVNIRSVSGINLPVDHGGTVFDWT